MPEQHFTAHRIKQIVNTGLGCRELAHVLECRGCLADIGAAFQKAGRFDRTKKHHSNCRCNKCRIEDQTYGYQHQHRQQSGSEQKMGYDQKLDEIASKLAKDFTNYFKQKFGSPTVLGELQDWRHHANAKLDALKVRVDSIMKYVKDFGERIRPLEALVQTSNKFGEEIAARVQKLENKNLCSCPAPMTAELPAIYERLEKIEQERYDKHDPSLIERDRCNCPMCCVKRQERWREDDLARIEKIERLLDDLKIPVGDWAIYSKQVDVDKKVEKLDELNHLLLSQMKLDHQSYEKIKKTLDGLDHDARRDISDLADRIEKVEAVASEAEKEYVGVKASADVHTLKASIRLLKGRVNELEAQNVHHKIALERDEMRLKDLEQVSFPSDQVAFSNRVNQLERLEEKVEANKAASEDTLECLEDRIEGIETGYNRRSSRIETMDAHIMQLSEEVKLQDKIDARKRETIASLITRIQVVEQELKIHMSACGEWLEQGSSDLDETKGDVGEQDIHGEQITRLEAKIKDMEECGHDRQLERIDNLVKEFEKKIHLHARRFTRLENRINRFTSGVGSEGVSEQEIPFKHSVPESVDDLAVHRVVSEHTSHDLAHRLVTQERRLRKIEEWVDLKIVCMGDVAQRTGGDDTDAKYTALEELRQLLPWDDDNEDGLSWTFTKKECED